MPIWLTALKVIPWGDVVAAAPTVARSARELWRGVRGPADAPTGAVAAPAVPMRDDALESIALRVASLEERLRALNDEAAASAEVVSSLAEQNQRLVEAVAILRARTRLLLVAVCVLAAGLGGVAWHAFG
jgi:hypothetical protein